MSLTNCFVVARWTRPLIELRVNAELDSLSCDDWWSWQRDDGWQCFAPEEFYRGVLLPPVDEIARETGGPVLGLGVQSSSFWEAAFRSEGSRGWIAVGATEDKSAEVYDGEMVQQWGAPWRGGAAAALRHWAAPWADVSQEAIEAAITIPHVFAEGVIVDLLRLLTLVPDAGWPASFLLDPVDESAVPGARYAIDAVRVSFDGLVAPKAAHHEAGMVLALTAAGYGIWDRAGGSWLHEPVLGLGAALDSLRDRVLASGWVAASAPWGPRPFWLS